MLAIAVRDESERVSRTALCELGLVQALQEGGQRPAARGCARAAARGSSGLQRGVATAPVSPRELVHMQQGQVEKVCSRSPRGPCAFCRAFLIYVRL